jgi:hypothetical protein
MVQLLKNFPAFYGTPRFITVFTRALHWSLSQINPIHPLLSKIQTYYFSENLVAPGIEPGTP